MTHPAKQLSSFKKILLTAGMLVTGTHMLVHTCFPFNTHFKYGLTTQEASTRFQRASKTIHVFTMTKISMWSFKSPGLRLWYVSYTAFKLYPNSPSCTFMCVFMHVCRSCSLEKHWSCCFTSFRDDKRGTFALVVCYHSMLSLCVPSAIFRLNDPDDPDLTDPLNAGTDGSSVATRLIDEDVPVGSFGTLSQFSGYM